MSDYVALDFLMLPKNRKISGIHLHLIPYLSTNLLNTANSWSFNKAIGAGSSVDGWAAATTPPAVVVVGSVLIAAAPLKRVDSGISRRREVNQNINIY